jgi:hypothetical protein
MLVKYFGFRRAFEIYSLYLFAWCVLYFLFCGNFLIFGNPCTTNTARLQEGEELRTLIRDDLTKPTPNVKIYSKDFTKITGSIKISAPKKQHRNN